MLRLNLIILRFVIHLTRIMIYVIQTQVS